MPPKGKYTNPKLRDEVKEEVQQGDKGGAPGQWSARKAQFMASEYKKRGGGYTTDKESGQDESQKHLSKWTEEEWQTKEGSGTAKHDDGTRDRYLPKKAWEQMDEGEKEETNKKKKDASKEGQQFVGNTEKAKQARKDANEQEDGEMEEKKSKQQKGGQKNSQKQKTGKQANGDAPRRSGRGPKKEDDKSATQSKGDEGDEDFEDPGADDDAEAPEHPDTKNDAEDSKAGQKRGRPAKKNEGDSSKKQKTDSTSSKKQKPDPNKPNGAKDSGTFGSKHDNPEAPAPAASKDRLPKKGQRVSWKALPGWVHGECVEILTESKEINGKMSKASKEDPRIVCRSDNGKDAVHKADKVHFED